MKQKEITEKFLTYTSAEASLSQFTDPPSESKKSQTPTSPKSKQPPPAGQQAKRKTPSAVPSNELINYFNSNYFALYLLSLLSKAVCVTSTNLSKIQPFERIAQLSFEVNTVNFELKSFRPC
jgi:hypothetical protein